MLFEKDASKWTIFGQISLFVCISWSCCCNLQWICKVICNLKYIYVYLQIKRKTFIIHTRAHTRIAYLRMETKMCALFGEISEIWSDIILRRWGHWNWRSLLLIIKENENLSGERMNGATKWANNFYFAVFTLQSLVKSYCNLWIMR